MYLGIVSTFELSRSRSSAEGVWGLNFPESDVGPDRPLTFCLFRCGAARQTGLSLQGRNNRRRTGGGGTNPPSAFHPQQITVYYEVRNKIFTHKMFPQEVYGHRSFGLFRQRAHWADHFWLSFSPTAAPQPPAPPRRSGSVHLVEMLSWDTAGPVFISFGVADVPRMGLSFQSLSV